MFRWPITVAVINLVAVLACSSINQFNPLNPATATPVPTPTAAVSSRQQQVFEALADAVREKYVRADYDGVDWEAVEQKYRAQVNAGLSDTAFGEMVEQMLAELPRGTASYVSREERIALETSDVSTYKGIGVFYGTRTEGEPRVVVLHVITGSPAELGGLKPHDAIYAIDGQPITAEELPTISNRIRGPEGSEVKLTLQTPGQARRTITLERGVITTSDSVRITVTDKVMYIRAPVPAIDSMAEQIIQELQQTAGEIEGIVLDLRISSGGGGWPFGEMVTLFTSGDFGEFYTRAETQPISTEGVDVAGSQKLPLVVLVGPDTRGSAEIFAAIVQNTGRAKLVGLPTPGDFEGLEEIDLPDGSRLSLATSSFRLPNGTDPSILGVQPDVTVNADWDSFAAPADDEVLARGLEELAR
ncbi:MAG: PDZ domain-containing protein [Anaerolineales bacterium]|nr:PDZ domain-containing protein [Anaerolineales bacterium]